MFDIDDITRYITKFSKTPNKNGEYLAEVEYEFAWRVPLSDGHQLIHQKPGQPKNNLFDVKK